ncbi:MAG TPA: hypothetical protein VIK72_18845 [Clostridiaceae bacterium]
MRNKQLKHNVCFILTSLMLTMNIQVFANTVANVTSVSPNKTADILAVCGTDILTSIIASTIGTIIETSIDGKKIATCVVMVDTNITSKSTDSIFKCYVYSLIGKNYSQTIIYSDVRK